MSTTTPAPGPRPTLRQRFAAATVTIGLPTLAATILALVGGVLQVINYSLIPGSSVLHGYIALALYFLLASGIPPLVGPAFKAALHLPAWASYLLSALLGVGMLAVGTVPMPDLAREIISAAVTVLSALGFSPAVVPVAPTSSRTT